MATATKGTTMATVDAVFGEVEAIARDARYRARGVYVRREGGVVKVATREGGVVAVFTAVGVGRYVEAWQYDANDWRADVIDASDVSLRATWAIESAAFDR